MNIHGRLEKMERQLQSAGRSLTPERERQMHEVIEQARRRDPTVARADGTVDLTLLSDAELIEMDEIWSASNGR